MNAAQNYPGGCTAQKKHSCFPPNRLRSPEIFSLYCFKCSQKYGALQMSALSRKTLSSKVNESNINWYYLTVISWVKSFAGPSCNFSSSWVSGILYKFHSMTGTLMFLLSCFVYVRELLGEHIHCIADVADASGQTVS